ncbi:MAG: deoxyribonuclease V [Niabella sp.]
MISPARYDSLTPTEAVACQRELYGKMNLDSLEKPIKIIGGCDISFNKYEETVYAGIVLLRYPDMQVIDRVSVVASTKFPYIPGLLAFREVPALMQVWNKLDVKPDVLMLDGHGIAHPRRMGIAAHFGIVADTPTIGCAKSRLTGTYAELPNERFASTPLLHKGEQIGNVLCSKLNCKPLFVSPGYKVSMQQSLDIVKACLRKYRMPEPTRFAHLWVNEVRKAKGDVD